MDSQHQESTPWPPHGPGYDRRTEQRDDGSWLAHRWTDPHTRVVAIAGTRVPTGAGGLTWTTAQAAPEGERLLLGEDDRGARFAVLTSADYAETRPEGGWVPLRGALGLLAEEDVAWALHAVGLAEWRQATRHCPRDGARLWPRSSGHVLACPECGRDQFPRIDPAVIAVVVAPGDEERCLLGHNPRWPVGRYSTLAGFVEPGENLEDAVRREVEEECGVRVGRVEYFGSQAWPLPQSLMLGFVAHAETTQVHVDGDEITDARWFTREQMRVEAEAGSVLLPGGVSISRHLVEHWYGGPLPGSW